MADFYFKLVLFVGVGVLAFGGIWAYVMVEENKRQNARERRRERDDDRLEAIREQEAKEKKIWDFGVNRLLFMGLACMYFKEKPP